MHLLLKTLSLSLLAGAGFTFAKPPTGTATVNILASPKPHVAVACLDANALIVPLGECATFTAEPAMKGAAIIQNPDGLPCGFNPNTFECVSGAGTAFEVSLRHSDALHGKELTIRSLEDKIMCSPSPRLAQERWIAFSLKTLLLPLWN